MQGLALGLGSVRHQICLRFRATVGYSRLGATVRLGFRLGLGFGPGF